MTIWNVKVIDIIQNTHNTWHKLEVKKLKKDFSDKYLFFCLPERKGVHCCKPDRSSFLVCYKPREAHDLTPDGSFIGQTYGGGYLFFFVSLVIAWHMQGNRFLNEQTVIHYPAWRHNASLLTFVKTKSELEIFLHHISSSLGALYVVFFIQR